jgi:hypothetical protein
MNTKNSSIAVKAFLAALAAVALVPVGPAAATIAFTATGLLAVLASDYGRDVEPLRAPSGVVPFETSDRGEADMGKAA